MHCASLDTPIPFNLELEKIFYGLFKSGRICNTVYLNQTSLGRRDVRIFYIGASYRFGQTKKVNKKEKLQFDTEQ